MCPVCKGTGMVTVWVYDSDGAGWEARPCSAPGCEPGKAARSALWDEEGGAVP